MDRNYYIKRITIYKDKRGEYRWRMQAWNWKIIANSGEGYKTFQNCLIAVNKLYNEISGYIEIYDKENNKVL